MTKMEITDLPIDKKIILFDGVCNLCDNSVQFIIKHDKNDIFRFVALQSELGQKIIKHLGIQDRNINSIILYEPNIAYYYKAEAIKKIVSELDTWHKILSFFIPNGAIGNYFYDFVAKNRYKWYGKKESCMIPTSAILNKFL